MTQKMETTAKGTSKRQWCLDNGIPEKYISGVMAYADKMKSAKAFAIAETITFDGESFKPATNQAFLVLWRARGNVQAYVIGNDKREMFFEVPRIGFVAEYKHTNSSSIYIDCYLSDESFTKAQALILHNCPTSTMPFEKAYLQTLSRSRLFKSPALIQFERTKQDKMNSIFESRNVACI